MEAQGKTLEAHEKTLEEEGPPFGGCPSPSKPPSSPRTSLHGNRRFVCENFSRFWVGGCRTGKFLGGLGGANFRKVRLSRLICEWDAIRWNTIHECRDSACRRPFGVRLRGSFSFYRLISDLCAAPLRMTQWVWHIVGYNLFVACNLNLISGTMSDSATVSNHATITD